jgi:cytochrome c oxidase subunit 2
VRYWSILFAVVAALCVAAFAYAPFAADWWLPNPAGEYRHVVSTFGRKIDDLYFIILGITGIAFIGTQAVLVIAQYRFADKLGPDGKPVRPAQYFHGSQRLEVIWTIIPASILVFIALYQMDTWASIKLIDAQENPLGIDREDPAAKDDVTTLNQLYLPANKPILIRLRSKDVIHSFGVPEFRVKQDAVPGLTIPIYFVPTITTAEMRTRTGNGEFQYEIACAQLCGLGHYRMRGFVTVLPQDEFQKWLDERVKEASAPDPFK